MPILEIIVVFVVVGVLLWLINAYVPMQESVKKLLNIAVIVILVIWLVSMFIPLGHLSNVRIGR